MKQSIMIGGTMLLCSSAQAQLYGCGPWTLGSPSPALYEIDPATANSTQVGTGSYFAASGMTYDGERILMGTRTAVYTVDQETGATTLLHSFGDHLTLVEGAIAANPGSGELILINKTVFAKMDLVTGAVDVVYDDGVGLDLSGATFDDQGRLWAVYLNGPSSHLSQINPETGLRMTIDILPLPFALPSVGGMAFDSDAGDLLVVSGSKLVNIGDINNPTTMGDVGLPSMSGLVYVPQENVCDPDLNNDGVLDFFDVSAFLTAFGTMESAADFNDDGVFDFFDVSEFLSAFAAGCP